MNIIEKQAINISRYGHPKPGLMRRIFGSLRPITLPLADVNRHQTLWTAPFSWKKASKPDLVDQGYHNVTVYSVINAITRVAAQPQWGVYNIKDRRKYDQYQAVQKQAYSEEQQFKLMKLKEDSLEPNDYHQLNRVLQHPNDQQSGSEYMENLLGMKLLTGDSYEFANAASGSGQIAELWVLPSQHVTIQTNEPGSRIMEELGYLVQLGSTLVKYEPEEVCHSKYWNPAHNGAGSHLYGFSPLDAAWLSNMQDMQAREAAVEILKNRGARGVFTFTNDQIQEYAQFQETKGELLERWSQYGKEYKDKIIPLFGEGRWHDIGLNAKDMAIIELCKMNKDDICNAYGISSILLNNHEASTDNNYQHARKARITDVVLPLLGTIRDARNRKLRNGDWNPKRENITVDFDQTIFTELESDKKSIADWMDKAACFTDNEKRIQLGYEPISAPYSDDIWKRTNVVPISLVDKDTITRNSNRDEQGV